MTAYGKREKSASVGSFVVEIQTLNRKHLEISIYLPKSLNALENEIRKRIEKKLHRGQVKVTVFFRPEENQTIPVFPNLPLAVALKEGWSKITAVWGVSFQDILPFIAQEKDLLVIEEEEGNDTEIRETLFQVIDESLEQIDSMRLQEGQNLAHDFSRRINAIEDALDKISAQGDQAVSKYRQKLTQRLDEFREALADHQERIMREVALMAEKMDMTEELIRFKSHLSQARTLLQKPFLQEKETKGKMLEFLIQEMGREANTIGAKNQELAISQAVFFIKLELEKMREQVQNIE